MPQSRLQKLLTSGKITKEEYNKRIAQSKQARSTIRKQSIVRPVRISGSNGKRATMQVRQPRRTQGMSQTVFEEGRTNANIKTMIAKSIPLVSGDPAKNYLRTLIDNTHYHSRFPDSDLRETALCNSVVVYDIPLTPEVAAGSATSRFSFALQPIVGEAGDDPTKFQCAVAYPTDGNGNRVDWSVADWTSANSYTQNIGSKNPAVDINATGLVANEPGYNSSQLVGTVFAGAQSAGGVVTVTDRLITGATSVTQNWTQTVHAANTNWDLPYNGPEGPKSFYLPPGVFEIVITQSATLIAPAASTLNPVLITNLDANHISLLENHVVVSSPGATVAHFGGYFIVEMKAAGWIAPIMVDSSTSSYLQLSAYSATSMDISFLQMSLPGLGSGSSAASVARLIRPVAQTVLCTYFGQTLINGGRIAGAYVDKATLTDNFFNNCDGQGFGNYQFVQNLENVKEPFGGPLKDGCYAWWAPMSPSDYDLTTVNEMNDATWPSIIVSGYYENGTTGAGLLSTPITGIVKVRVVTTFEYTTTSTFVDSQKCVGSQAAFDACNKALMDAPHVMENKTHPDFINRIMSFFKNHGGDFVNAGRALAPVAGTLLSMI